MSTGRSAPGVRIASLADIRDAQASPIDVRGRILGFTYEESDVRADKVLIELDNFDGSLFDRAELLGGALLEVSWGYPGCMAPPRRAVVRKLTGYAQLTVEAHGLAALWNDKATTQRWLTVTRSDVARTIAASHGYEGSFAIIDETEERFDVLVQAGETDAWFLRRLAAKEHFLFAIDGDGFHFHARRQDDAPERVLTYYSDPSLGNVKSIGVDSDLTRRPGAVVVRGRDPMAKATIEARSNADTAPRGTLCRRSRSLRPRDRRRLHAAVERDRERAYDLGGDSDAGDARGGRAVHARRERDARPFRPDGGRSRPCARARSSSSAASPRASRANTACTRRSTS